MAIWENLVRTKNLVKVAAGAVANSLGQGREAEDKRVRGMGMEPSVTTSNIHQEGEERQPRRVQTPKSSKEGTRKKV